MKEWLCVDASVVDRALLGETFEDKSFGFTCDGSLTTIGEIDSDIPFYHGVIQTDDSSILVINKGDTSHVNVTLYDVAGDKEKTLRHMLKPNTWPEINSFLTGAGFKNVQVFWRNHNFLGAIAVK